MDKLNYPNPQFIRKKWFDLNGEWQFFFDDENKGLKEEAYKMSEQYDQIIQVPYSYHVKDSGIQKNELHQIVWYKKELPDEINSESRYVLHFGAVDFECDVWINGMHVKHHVGGHVPFSVDVTHALQPNHNQVVVRVLDENSTRQAIGKQSWKDHNFLCWYTRTVGIWQQVWLEETGMCYLTDVRMTPNIDQATIEIDATVNEEFEETYLSANVLFEKEKIQAAKVLVKNKRVKFSLDVSDNQPNFRLNFWTPNTPNLYDIELSVTVKNRVTDEVMSYFGMRNVTVKGKKVYLNNQEFYQKLILDQGYFKDGGLTATPEQLLNDVTKIKEMGFNGVRKHQKVEDHRFMYLCDRLGLVMWAEMPSPFEYSAETNQNIFTELHPFITKHYNHPAVIIYTVMNESWGINEVYHNKQQQAFVNALYYATKSLDQSRLVVGNDGWEHTLTDILTLHDYNDNPETMKASYLDTDQAANGSPSRTSTRHAYAKGYSYQQGPFMVSEYGGIAYEESQESDAAWGYGERLASKEAIVERIADLTKVLMDNPDMCGFCYTQLSDVEQEVNGLLDADHNYKFDPNEIKKIMTYKHNLGFVFI